MKKPVLINCAVCLGLGLSTGSVLAEESKDKGSSKPNAITQKKFSLGISSSNGNSDSLSVNGSLSFAYYKQRWTHDVESEVLYIESNDVKSSERAALSYSLGYILGPGKYLFNLASAATNTRYRPDFPDGLETRIYYDVFGYGFPITQSKRLTMDAMLGVGARKTEYVYSNQEVDEVIGHLGIDTAWRVTPSTQFSNQLILQPGKDNNYAEMTNALTVSMSDKFSLRLSHSNRYNTDPPAVFEKHDSQTSVNVIVNF